MAQIALAPVASGFDRPVQVVTAHDGTHDLYVAQQDGRIFRVAPARTELFLDIRDVVQCCENGGLLSIVFHPTNRQLFALYVDKNGDTAVARYTGTTPQLLFVQPQPKDNIPNHHGGTLQFGPDGMLYISIGDGGAYVKVTNRAQELDHLLGKLLRIDVDRGSPYAIPPDNPFVATPVTSCPAPISLPFQRRRDACAPAGETPALRVWERGRPARWTAGVSPARHPNARPEIWSFGLRNPWRFSFDRLTGDLLLGDVGQDSYEELDLTTIAAARGANFGWPLMEGAHCFVAPCSTNGLTLPSLEYPRALGCSVTGGYRYRGTREKRFRDTYFYGDWCSGRIWGATESGYGQWDSRVLLETSLAIVSFGEDDDGELYVVDYNGRVFRIVDAAPPRVRVTYRAS